jgi:ribosomal protein L7/L12
MEKRSAGRILAHRLLQMDEARNARPHTLQQPSEMVKERNVRLANQAEKIAALKWAREAAGIKLFEGDRMAR